MRGLTALYDEPGVPVGKLGSYMRSIVTLFAVGLTLISPSSVTAQFQLDPNMSAGEWGEFTTAVFGGLAEELNSDLVVPRPILITATACQTANAFFVAGDRGEPERIIMCTELLDAMTKGIVNRQLQGTVVGYAIMSQATFVFLHEVGHALVHVLDLPVVGQEEDVADQLAALLFSAEPILAMWAAEFWKSDSGSEYVSLGEFADEHDLGPQRYFNILCWAYGADPFTRTYIVSGSTLPPARAQRCPGEYSRLRRGWENLLAPYLRNAENFSDDLDPTRNASGYWRFIEAMESNSDGTRCSASGTLELWQLGEELAGSMRQEGSCISQMVPFENNAEAAITSGTADEQGLKLVLENCTYQGTFVDESRMTIEGTLSCVVEGGEPLIGSWRAVR
jgi:putative metallopeptidase DUF4344